MQETKVLVNELYGKNVRTTFVRNILFKDEPFIRKFISKENEFLCIDRS